MVFLGMFYYNSQNTNYYFKLANVKLDEYKIKKKDFVVIIDYRKNILSKRLYLLDIKNNEVILSCRVSHAKKSGLFYAKKFSNEPNSEKSSVGAFITKYSRPGKNGYSMVISGLDRDNNDNVEKRVIIFHPTRIPWSKGCFATYKTNNKIIIDHIKDGRLVYVIS